MKLGYACINLTLGRTFRTLRLTTLQTQGLAYLQVLVNENMHLLADILRWNREQQIMMYRLSSDLVPFDSHDAVDLQALAGPLHQEIARLGQGMRPFHPSGPVYAPIGSGRDTEAIKREVSTSIVHR